MALEEAQNDGAAGPESGHQESGDQPRDPSVGGGLEQRLKRLESIVTALDSDSLELDQALALFEEGVGHVRDAQEMLAKAELKVQELIGPQGEEVRDFPSGADRDGG